MDNARIRTSCSCEGRTRVVADNPDIKLLLEFCALALTQAGANSNDLIAAFLEKGMCIRQLSFAGLIPLRSDWTSDSAGWYVNLFASRIDAVTDGALTMYERERLRSFLIVQLHLAQLRPLDVQHVAKIPEALSSGGSGGETT